MLPMLNELLKCDKHLLFLNRLCLPLVISCVSGHSGSFSTPQEMSRYFWWGIEGTTGAEKSFVDPLEL